MVDRNYEEDERPSPREGMFFEFDCPECNAHNPHPDGFRVDGETMCFYCGTEFKVSLSSGRLKLKPL